MAVDGQPCAVVICREVQRVPRFEESIQRVKEDFKRKQRRKPKRRFQRNGRPAKKSDAPSRTAVRLRKVAEPDVWEFVHPRCALERAEDIEELQKMLDAGEFEIAVDELRWLLEECKDFILAHKMLGELAMLDGDVPLARGHFGYAFNIGTKALRQEGVRGQVPYHLENNQAFLEAGKGLLWCLKELGKRELGLEVADQMLSFDTSDPLGIAALREQVAQLPEESSS